MTNARPADIDAPDAIEDDRPVGVALVVALGSLSGFAPLSIDMYLPGLPALQRQFHAPASLAQLSLTGCLAGLAVAQVVIGPLSDRVGRRKPLLIGVGAFAAVSFLCAAAPWLWLFLVLRLVEGASGAAGIVIARAIVRDLRSGAPAARLFALLMLVNGLFPALAPVIGAQLLRVGSWRAIFVVLGALGVAELAFAWRFVPETLTPERRRAGGLRVVTEALVRCVRDRRFVAYAVAAGCCLGAMFAYISGSPFVLEDIFKVSPQAFSAVFAANAAGILIASQCSQRLVARVGPERLFAAGITLSLVGATVLVACVLGGVGLVGVLPALFLVVSAVGLVAPNATALAMAEYPDVAGAASGLVGVLQFLIGGIAAPIVGAFGTRTALPMATTIVVLAALSALVPIVGLRAAVLAAVNDEEAMQAALVEAVAAVAHGDVPVGAVVVIDGEIVARRHNERERSGDPAAHAELLALRDAATRDAAALVRATLVVTLEPCVMCAGAIREARLARVVFGATDPKAGAGGSRYDVLRDERLGAVPEVMSGVGAAESEALLVGFFRRLRSRADPVDAGPHPEVRSRW